MNVTRDRQENAVAAPLKHGARNEALEASCLENPDDLAALDVWADWLQEQGDPLGTLISLERTAATRNDEAAVRAARLYFAEHRALFLGRLADPSRYACSLEWSMGLIRTAHLGIRTYAAEPGLRLAERLTLLLELPVARLLERLRIGDLRPEDRAVFGEAMTALTAKVRPSVRTLDLGVPLRGAQVTLYGALTGLPKLGPALPNLRSLTLEGDSAQLGGLSLPKLEHLSVRLHTWRHSVAHGGLSNAELPGLRSLELGLRTQPPVEHLIPRRARLHTLKVWGRIELNTLVQLLAQPVIETLECLDLSNAHLSDAHAGPLVAAAARLAKLNVLDLQNNELDVPKQERLREVFDVRVKLANQITPEDRRRQMEEDALIAE